MNGIFGRFFDSADGDNRRRILGLLERDVGAEVLDCGCGSGEFTAQIGVRIGTSNLVGLDDYGPDVEQARVRGIRTICGDINKGFGGIGGIGGIGEIGGIGVLDDGVFDVVHANQTIEHIIESDLFLREVYRVIKPGGYLVLSTPNLASWHNVVSLLLGWQPFTADVSFEAYVGNPLRGGARGDHRLGHVRLFTYRALRELLQYHGFRVERLVGAGYYPLPGRVNRLWSMVDPRHAVYLTAKARKGIKERSG